MTTTLLPRSAALERALEFVLQWEGGLYLGQEARDPNPTHFGITLRTLRGLGSLGDLDGDGDVDVQDVVHMTRDQAEAIYDRVYWHGPNCDDVAEVSAKLAIVLFDSGVQHGIGTASSMFQRTVRATPDGRIGRLTLASCRIRLQQMSETKLVEVFLERRRGLYAAILLRDPKMRPNRNGWRNRLNDLCTEVGLRPLWPKED